MVFECPAKIEECNEQLRFLQCLKQMVNEIENDMACPPSCKKPCLPTTCPACITTEPCKTCKTCKSCPYCLPSELKACCCHSKPKTAEVRSGKRPGLLDNPEVQLKRVKSFELRASFLYHGCECEKRYGLQDDCPRTGCHGSPECLTKPPTCGPSEFCEGKHLAEKFVRPRRKAQKIILG